MLLAMVLMKLTLTEVIDTFRNLNNRTTAVEKEICNRTLHFYMGKIQNYGYSINYVGQIMLYLVTISEQHLSIFEFLIHTLEQIIKALYILNT